MSSRHVCASHGVPPELLDAAAKAGLNWSGILQLILKNGLPMVLEILTAILVGSPNPSPAPSVTPSIVPSVTGAILLFFCLACGGVVSAGEPPPYRDNAPAYVQRTETETVGDTSARTLNNWEFTCHRGGSSSTRSGSTEVQVVQQESVNVEAKTAPSYRSVCTPNGCYLVPVQAEVKEAPAIKTTVVTAPVVAVPTVTTTYAYQYASVPVVVSETYSVATVPAAGFRGIGIARTTPNGTFFVGIGRLK